MELEIFRSLSAERNGNILSQSCCEKRDMMNTESLVSCDVTAVPKALWGLGFYGKVYCDIKLTLKFTLYCSCVIWRLI